MPAADMPAAEVPAATAPAPDALVPALALPPTAAVPDGVIGAFMPALGGVTFAPAAPLLVPAAPLGVGLAAAVPALLPVETPAGCVPGAGVSPPHAPHNTSIKHASR